MFAKIQKWGNSFGVRIPKTIMEQANLSENSEVEIQHKNGAIVILPIKKKLSLKNLLEKITEKNLPQLEDGLPVGNEVW
jgi:antitoxin MazE